MSNKTFSLMLGLLLIAGGIFYFFRDVITISYGAVCSIILGAAFTITYFKKKKGWYLLPGIYLLFFGIARAFLYELPAYNYIATSVFFFAPGTIFLIFYFSSEGKKAFLTFGLLLMSIGMCALLSALDMPDDINIFLLCIGSAFVINYIVGLNYENTSTLVIGVILMLLSVRKLLSEYGFTDIIISVLLIIAGFAVIIKALFKKGD